VQTFYYIVLVPMVYLAFGVFFVGTAVRLAKIFRAPKHPSTLQIFPERRAKWTMALYDTFLLPTVRKHKPVLWAFLMVFHLAFLLVILGHLELFKEFRIFQIVPHEVFMGKGFVGLILSISLLYFLFRRFSSPVRELSVSEDYYLLVLLFLTVFLGSQLDWARRWYEYSELNVEDYRRYLLSLLFFKPELPLGVSSSGHSFMLVVHVFLGNLFLMFFPFSQSIHSFLSLSMNKLRRG